MALFSRTHRQKNNTAGWAILLGGTMLFSTVAAPAQAFFGPVCIPRLENCNCTFIFPCPVFDLGTHASTGHWRTMLNVQKKNAEEMTEQFSQMSKGLACDAMGSVPGLNAVGIDINALIKAQIPDLNINSIRVPGLESLKRQMESLSLDSDLLQQVVSGQMSPDMFLKAAQDAGVDVNQLTNMGLSLSSLQDLAKGNTNTLLNLGLDRIGTDLSKLGMAQNALRDLAAGNMTVDDFRKMASESGIGQGQLNSLGLPAEVLHGLSSGDMAGFGLPALDNVLGKGARISIDSGRLQNMLAGQTSPKRLLDMAKAAGLSPSTLQTMGVSQSTLESLNSGSMSPQQLLEVSGALNFRAEALSSLGINETLLTSISSGKLQPQALLNIAQGAGLSTADLSKIGLDANGLNTMLANGSTGLMETLQKAGMGNPILDGLNIDAGMLGKIAAGDLPAGSITDMLAKSGLPANAIVIPGVDGAVSALGRAGELADGPLNAINDQLGSFNTDISQMINIPIPSIPGLGSIVGSCGAGIGGDVAVGGGIAGTPEGTPPTAGNGEGTGTGGGAGTTTGLGGTNPGGSACMPNRPLISATMPPHEYGNDVTTIDFALAGGGDIFIQQEAIADARAEANRVYAGAAARAIVLRPLITQALDSLRGIEEQMLLVDAMGTTEEAWRMNSAIKVHTMAATAEIASLQSFRASVQAATVLNPVTYTALPLFPHGSEWDRDFQETVKKDTDALVDTSKAALEASQDYNDFYYQARAIRDAHEMATHHNKVAATMGPVVENIRIHEAQKENQYYMETQLRTALADLYTDPEAAWKILKADMDANAGSYDSTTKWTTSQNHANTLSTMLTADTDTTRYGKRIKNRRGPIQYRDDDTTVYSTTPEMPFSYPYVNERLLEGDPMQIKKPRPMSRDDDVVVPVMTGGIQTYMETYRREQAWGAIRRGAANGRTTSGTVWNEMLDFAPSCMSGPLPTTASNLLKRPDLFDIAPSCSHITWTDGDAEDYIAPSNFGGSDAILWQSKIDMDQAILQAGASNSADLQPTIARRANAAIRDEEAQKIEQRLREVGYTAAAQHVARLRTMLGTIAGDTALRNPIKTPLITP